MEIRSPGEQFVARVTDLGPGLVGTLQYRIVRRDDGTVVTPYSTAMIAESAPGQYDTLITTPSLIGELRIEWDAQDGTLGPSADLDVVQDTTVAMPPSAGDVVAATPTIPWDQFGYDDAESLQDQVDEAVGYVEWVSGRTLDSTLPGNLTYLARKAVRLRTIQQVYQESEDLAEMGSDDLTQSFTAGSYSESRRDPTRRGETKLLNSWLALNEILWMLLTPAKYDYWVQFLSGKNVPSFDVTEVDWALPTTSLTTFPPGLGWFGAGYGGTVWVD